MAELETAMIGDWHSYLDGTRYRETFHGPNEPATCIDCGAGVYVIVDTGRINAHGVREDVPTRTPRCSTCGRGKYGAPVTVGRSPRGVCIAAGPHSGTVRPFTQGDLCELHNPMTMHAAGTPLAVAPNAEERNAWKPTEKPAKPLGLPRNAKKATARKPRKAT